MQSVTTSIATDLPLYVGLNPKGVVGKVLENGNIMQINAQGKSVIAGRELYKKIDNLPITQTSTAVMPIDPTTLIVAAALMSITQQLDALEKKTEEILLFLKLDKQSKQRGNLDMLSDIMEEYRRDAQNESMCALRAIAVQDIKRDAQQDMIFYQKQIASRLQAQKALHLTQQAQALLDEVQGEFCEYQLACYLYAYTSFLEILLQKRFDTAQSVADRMEECARKYDALYASCHEQLAAYQRTTLGAHIAGLAGSTAQRLGQSIADHPVLSRGPVDELLLGASKKIGQSSKNDVARRMERLSPLEDSRMTPFIDSVRTINALYTQPDALLTDGESLYIPAP